jgi:hypothetical protein
MYDPTGVDAVVAILNVSVALDPGVSETLETLNEIEGPFVAFGDTDVRSETVPVKCELLTYRIAAE